MDVSKGSPVARYIQVTEKKPLILLRQFCQRDTNLQNGNYQQELFELNSQLPLLWPQIVNICTFEKSDFPPIDVANIILTLLKIRRNTFKNGPQRYH